MKRLIGSIVIGSAFFFGATPLFAATKSERIKSCIAGTLSEDEKEQLALDMSTWNIFFSDYARKNASKCFEFLTGKNVEFIDGSGLNIDGDGLEKYRAYREGENERKTIAEKQRQEHLAEIKIREEERQKLKLKIDAEVQAKALKQAENRETLKCDLLKKLDDITSKQAEFQKVVDFAKEAASDRKREVNLATLKRCADWYRKDERAALTNNICNQVFLEAGLPGSAIDAPSLEELLNAKRRIFLLSLESFGIGSQLDVVKVEEDFLTHSTEEDLVRRKMKFTQDTENNSKENEAYTECEMQWKKWRQSKD